MKRSILVATLALTPALLHAQATSPAPTSAEASLQARIAPLTDLKAASKNASSSRSSSSSVRISTGIVAPHLLQSLDLAAVPTTHSHVAAKDLTVVVTMTVDATGRPTQLALAQAADAALDQQIISALEHARFQPGTLDGQAFALPVRLQVVVPRGTLY